jgi:hypothetical protein
MRMSLLLLLTLLAGVGESLGDSIQLAVRLDVHGMVPIDDLKVVAETVDEGEPVEVTATATSPDVVLALSSKRRWRVSCRAAAHWCPKLEIQSGDPVTLPVYRAAQITARLTTPLVYKLPAFGTLQWQKRGSPRPPLVDITRIAIAKGEIAKGEISTTMPEGTWDLRLALDGFAAVYRFEVSPRDGVVDLGSLSLSPGSSVAGRVLHEASHATAANVSVQLSPAGLPIAPPGSNAKVESGRRMLQTRESILQPDGFFQFADVPPGRYELSAQSPQHARSVVLLDVPPDSEVYVDSFVLRPYFDGEVILAPPVDPKGQPWRLAMTRQGEGPAKTFSVTASSEGFVRLSRLEPGHYTIEVRGVSDNRVLRVVEPLSPELMPLRLQIPLVRVLGRVRRGDRPVPDAVVSIETGRSDHARFEANDKGEFEGFIPPLQETVRRLMVDIETEDSGRVFLNLDDLDPSADPLHLDIDLGLGLSGLVVDQQGRAVGDATVSASGLGGGGGSDAVSDGEGRFMLEGLRSGRYELLAEHGRVGTSDRLTVDLSASQRPEVTLILRPWRPVHGTLRSSVGAPVPNARLQLITDTGHRARANTDAAGAFAVQVPSGAQQLITQAFAPSQVLWAGCHPLPASPDLNLEISLPAVPGGTLRLPPLPRPAKTDTTPKHIIVLTEQGGFLAHDDLLNWRSMRGGPVGGTGVGELPISGLAPGAYAMIATPLNPETIVPALCAGGVFGTADWVLLLQGGDASLVLSNWPKTSP